MVKTGSKNPDSLFPCYHEITTCFEANFLTFWIFESTCMGLQCHLYLNTLWVLISKANTMTLISQGRLVPKLVPHVQPSIFQYQQPYVHGYSCSDRGTAFTTNPGQGSNSQLLQKPNSAEWDGLPIVTTRAIFKTYRNNMQI